MVRCASECAGELLPCMSKICPRKQGQQLLLSSVGETQDLGAEYSSSRPEFRLVYWYQVGCKTNLTENKSSIDSLGLTTLIHDMPLSACSIILDSFDRSASKWTESQSYWFHHGFSCQDPCHCKFENVASALRIFRSSSHASAISSLCPYSLPSRFQPR